MTTLDQFIQQAQTDAAREYQQQLEQAVTQHNAQVQRERSVAKKFSEQFNLDWDPNRCQCEEQTPDIYRIAILIDRDLDDWRDNDCEGARYLSVHINLDINGQIEPPNEWWGHDSHSGRNFPTMSEAILYATQGYVDPETKRVKNLVKLFQDLAAETTDEYPEMRIEFSLYDESACFIKAAQANGFTKESFGKNKGGAWKLTQHRSGLDHAINVYDDSIQSEGGDS